MAEKLQVIIDNCGEEPANRIITATAPGGIRLAYRTDKLIRPTAASPAAPVDCSPAQIVVAASLKPVRTQTVKSFGG